MGGRWIVKAVLQKAMSFTPDPQRANRFFQDRVTHGNVLTDEFLGMRIRWAATHLDALRRLGDASRGFSAIELGSGWFPIVPLCYFLAGAGSVDLVDLEDLSRPDSVTQAMRGVIDAHRDGRLAPLGPIDPGRVEELGAVSERVGRLGHVRALGSLGLRIRPVDLRGMEVDRQPSLISSNTVLEHIPASVLGGILVRFREIAGPGTVMSHLIDLCDHYAYVDDSVGVYHFLRYSDRQWRWIDNDVQPMNRLRASEYRDLYERAGVPITEEHLVGDDPSALVGEPLDARFAAMDPADVATKVSTLITRF